jgi:hypothetical protein
MTVAPLTAAAKPKGAAGAVLHPHTTTTSFDWPLAPNSFTAINRT